MPHKFAGKSPEELFRDIHVKCEKRGISKDQLMELSSVKKLRTKQQKPNSGIPPHISAAISVLVTVAVLNYGYQAVTVPARMWFYLLGMDLENEMCLVDMPLHVQTIFMPPFDCSICRNLTEVERVTNISPDEFEKKYAYSALPVIIEDGTKGWSALEFFSFEFFRDLYLEDQTESEEPKTCQFFPYKTEFYSLTEALNMSSGRANMTDGSKPWYIGWSNCDFEIGNALRKHYSKPYFLPLQSESSNIDWIFMGMPGYGAQMHIDHVKNPSWQAQIRGSKVWTLEPVPECYAECPVVEVRVRPGEVIVVDTNRWYHKTLIVGDELSITIGSEFD